MNHFWKWLTDSAQPDGQPARELELDGAIAPESWFGDEVTPAAFRAELMAGDGPVVVRIHSPGGDCFAAAQIYNMLRDYGQQKNAHVTTRIDGLAASAASVVAMAGDTVEISPVGMLMIHNPWTCAAGDRGVLKQAMQLLDESKESIINAYELKTSLPRSKLEALMDAETWMNANYAKELGFVDVIRDWGASARQATEASAYGSAAWGLRSSGSAAVALASRTRRPGNCTRPG
jgi:ATP-dependent Clp protease protease subunit